MRAVLLLLALCAPLMAAPAGLRLPSTFQQITAPTNIAGAVLWLDASQLGLTNGEAVSSWVDLSGAGNSATQSSAGLRPTYQTNGINGKAVVRFDGTSHFFTNLTSTMLDGLTGATMFTVIRFNSATANQIWFSSNGRLDQQQLSNVAYTYGASADYGSYANSSTNFHIRIAVFDGSQTGNSNRLRVAQNATSKSLSFTGTIPASFTTSSGYVLGALNSTPLVPFGGDIAVIILFNRALSLIEQSQVRGYLNNRLSVY